LAILRKIKRGVCHLTSRHKTPHLILPQRTQSPPTTLIVQNIDKNSAKKFGKTKTITIFAKIVKVKISRR